MIFWGFMALFTLYSRDSYTLYWITAIWICVIGAVSFHMFVVVRKITAYSYFQHLRHSDLDANVRARSIAFCSTCTILVF